MGRKKLPPVPQSWHWVEVIPENVLFRDCVIKRSRAKKFRTKSGKLEDGKLFMRVLCSDEKFKEIIQESEILELDLKEGRLLYLYKPKVPKIIPPTQKEEFNAELTIKLTEFFEAEQSLLKEPEDLYPLNKAAKALYETILHGLTIGLQLHLVYIDERERYAKVVGSRFDMTEFLASNERNSNCFSWQPLTLKNIKSAQFI